MKSIILSEIILPAMRRGGTGLSSYMVGTGIALEDAQAITGGAVVAVGLLVDLLLSHLQRKKGK